MTKRIVYVNPGDMLEVRVIRDDELPRNAAEWRHQVRPGVILLRVHDEYHLAHTGGMLRVDTTWELPN